MKGYQLKITIKGSKPPIWRRVIVPGMISFSHLDSIIEEIFGWTHEHLYEFYFRDEDARFTVEPDFDDDASSESGIDRWMWEGRKFLYVYDFGDNWEHEILVEKIVEYKDRFAQVVKSKGPYMIEDCGGIWGFYDCIEDAEEFNLERANEYLGGMEFPIFEEPEEPDFHEDALHNMDKFEEMGKILRQAFGIDKSDNQKPCVYLNEIESLEEVFRQYKKDDLVVIAKIHELTRYSGYKKNELAQWLANHLLDPLHMKKIVERADEEEIEIFEDAMETEDGISVSEDLIASSLFLSTYGAYNNFEVLRIPKDVAEKYRKICTPEFCRLRERRWLLALYCDSACYLYGVMPEEKPLEIFNQYEKEKLSPKEWREFLYSYQDETDAIQMEDGWLISDYLYGEYEDILEQQGDLPFYIPADREEFLNYGRLDCQEPDEHTRKFIQYLEKRFKLQNEYASMIFYFMQAYIRDEYPYGDYLELLQHYLSRVDESITGFKRMKEAEDQLKKFCSHIRLQIYRGHTPEEVRNMDTRNRKNMGTAPENKTTNKIISFPTGKKIYPNDPCPCGSGKKYKHCCGRTE